jgi:transketolase
VRPTRNDTNQHQHQDQDQDQQDGYIGFHGEMLSVERFGASAPADILLREYGFTVDNVCARAQALLTG